MKNILIATQNKDKFRILSKILTYSGLKNVNFFSLEDINILSQIKETGSVENRAYIKALEAQKLINGMNINIDFVIGSDDAMQINNEKIRTDSREVTNEILSGELLKINETLNIIRAFCFINNSNKGKLKFITKIPFSFIGNTESIKCEKGKYPLSYVLAPVGRSQAVAYMSDTEEFNYYLSHCKKAIQEKMKEISLL